MTPRNQMHRGRQSGMTLVELMIGLVVGLLVMASATSIFLTQQTTSQLGRSRQELQQQARFVLDLMSRDIRAAGDLACVPGITPVNLLPTGVAASYPMDQGGLRGTSYANGSLGTLPSWRGSGSIDQARSDVLVTYGLLSTSVLNTAMSSSQDATLDVRRPFTDWQAGDALMVSDCLSAAVLQVQLVSVNATDSTRLTLTLPSSSGLGKAFGAGATVGQLGQAWYWLREPSTSPRGLYRLLAGAAAPTLLGDLVQDMQLRYDTDTNADGLADTTDLAASAVTDWAQVIRVRIKLLMRSHDEVLNERMSYRFPSSSTSVTTATDRRLYQVIEQAVRIRNITQGP